MPKEDQHNFELQDYYMREESDQIANQVKI